MGPIPVKLLVILFCYLAAPAFADTPKPFGLEVRYAEDHPVNGQHSQQQKEILPGDLDRAEFSLLNMERELGPYHPDLASPTLEVAALAVQAEEFELAARLYDKALHNARVNNGLYGDQQLPILRGLLNLYLLSGDREGFEERAAYQLRLLGSGLPPFEEAELEAAAQLFDISLDALMDVPWEGRGNEILAFHDRFDSMTDAVCADPEVREAWCAPLSFRLGQFYYVLEYKLDVFVDDSRFEPRYTDPEWQSMGREPRLEALQRRLFRQGEQNFSRLVEATPSDHDALSALADWHWFYKKRSRALELYQNACRLQPDRFSLPGPLPEYPAIRRLIAFEPDSQSGLVTLSVNDRGQTRDVRWVEESQERPSRLRRVMRNTVFRPALNNCQQAMEAEDIELELVFLD